MGYGDRSDRSHDSTTVKSLTGDFRSECEIISERVMVVKCLRSAPASDLLQMQHVMSAPRQQEIPRLQ